MHPIDSQKDAIALFLFQKFVKGDDCVRLRQLRDDTHFSFAQYALGVAPTMFKQIPPDFQKTMLSSGIIALIKVLNCDEESVEDGLVDELSPKLEKVLNGESETLRPLLDILIERGVYPDPDLKSRSHLLDMSDAERAWRQEYQGTAHKTVLQDIQCSFKQGSAYSNSGAIIQSSGYGKSRMADEMATLIPTIPMNIRAVGKATQGAFPPADAALTQIFHGIALSDNPVRRLFLFFKLLFERVRNLAQDFKRSNFATRLYHYFDYPEKRAKFYANLLRVMAQNPGESRSEDAIASLQALVSLLPENEEPVKMVIYIDGAHTLASPNTHGPSMYDHILKATAKFASVGVFFLFISTDSRLEVLASHPELQMSSRFRAAGNILIAPFTEMPFDCHPSLVKDPIQPGLKLEEIQKFSFAVRFGRPLFWAYYEAMLNDNTEHAAHRHTLAMAQEKLVGNPTSKLSDMPENPGKLAILNTLLNLEYDPRRSHGHHLASTMVDSHMRTVYSIPTSRAYMDTGYPSEPVLAEAALTFINMHLTEKMFHWYDQPNRDQTTCLGPLLSLYRYVAENTSGAIDEGGRGENVGKIILLLAYTAAVKKREGSEYDMESWGEGCSLVEFFTELTADKFCQDVLVSTPDNVEGGLPLERMFEKSWVRFTHFARAADDFAMSSSMAWIAFIRGMAMIGCRSKDFVDVSIPILLDKDKPITEANMSLILVQFRARTARTVQDMVAIQEEAIKYFPPPESRFDIFADPNALDDARTEYHTRPYISLVMKLGLVPPSGNGSIPPEVVDLLDDLSSKPSALGNKVSESKHEPGSNIRASASPSQALQPSSGHTHPRYSLFYNGCSHKVYRCILDTDGPTCRTLLQIPTVFNDRASNRPIGPILQMKPFWSAGPNCFSWIHEPYLNQEYRGSKLGDDQVLIGNGGPVDVDQEPRAMDESGGESPSAWSVLSL